jgi:hypothetical protein
MGTTSVIPQERPKLGDSLREHLEDYAPSIPSQGTQQIDLESRFVVDEAARYFAFRYEGNPDPDFQHPRFYEMHRKMREVMEAVLGGPYHEIIERPNTGQDIIDRADEIEEEFYRRHGDPGEETGLDGGGDSLEHTPMGKQVQGRGHKLFR